LLFAHVFSKDVKTAAKVDLEGDYLVIFKHFDEGRNDYKGEFDTALIQVNFIEKHIFPTIMRFDEASA